MTASAMAALDTGQFTPQSVLSGRSPRVIDGVPLRNFGGENFGSIDLTTALTHSVNTVWAQVGERLGKRSTDIARHATDIAGRVLGHEYRRRRGRIGDADAKFTGWNKFFHDAFQRNVG